MSSVNMLTGNLYDLTRAPQADVVTIAPIIPTGIEDVEGVGVLDDGVLLPDAITVAASSQGEFSVLLIPTTQTLAGADGEGVRYRLTFGEGLFVEFDMPDGGAVTLAGLLLNRASTATLSPSARDVIYDNLRLILTGGDNVTLDVSDSSQTVTINATGGGGSGGDLAGDVAELQTEVATASRSIADANTQRIAGDDIQSVTISSAASYQSTLNSQAASANPLLLVIDAAISGTRGGAAYSYDAGDVLYFTPTSDAGEYLFNIEDETIDLSAYRTAIDQNIIDNRHTQGILLARQEAATADGKAVAAQEAIPERIPDAPAAAAADANYELRVPSSGESSWVAATTGGGGGGSTSGSTLLFSGNVDITTANTATAAGAWTVEPSAENAALMVFEFNDLITPTSGSGTLTATETVVCTHAQWLALVSPAAGAAFVTQPNFAYIQSSGSTRLFVSRFSDGSLSIGSNAIDADPTPLRVTGFTPRGPKGDKGDPGGTADLTAVNARIDTLQEYTNRVTPAGSWEITEAARTLRFGVRWATDIARGARASFVVGGITINVSTAEGYSAGDFNVLSVPVTSSNAGTISREATTSAGYVPVTVSIGGDTARTVMLAEAAATAPAPTAPTKQLMTTSQQLPAGTYELHAVAHRDVSGRRFFYSHTLPIEVLDVGRTSRMYLGEANPASPRDTNDVYVDLALASDRTLTFAAGGIAGWTVRVYTVRA